MSEFSSISELIAAWPKRATMAEDLNVTVARVHKWAQTNAIPARYLHAVLEAAQRRKIDISAADLIRLNAVPPAQEDAA